MGTDPSFYVTVANCLQAAGMTSETEGWRRIIIYVAWAPNSVAPPLAGTVMVLAYRRLAGTRRILTAKLFYPLDPTVRCLFRHCAFCIQPVDEVSAERRSA